LFPPGHGAPGAGEKPYRVLPFFLGLRWNSIILLPVGPASAVHRSAVFLSVYRKIMKDFWARYRGVYIFYKNPDKIANGVGPSKTP
jgi:hypothetical protein